MVNWSVVTMGETGKVSIKSTASVTGRLAEQYIILFDGL